MGNNSSLTSSKRKSAERNSSGDECQICLGVARPNGGGVAIVSPGCCGKFYHQACIYQMISSGNTACPNCRAPFSQDLISGASSGIQQAPLLNARPASINNFGNLQKKQPKSVGRSSFEEDELNTEKKATMTKMFGGVAAPAAPAVVTVAAVPEKNQMVLTETSCFHVNVNIKAADVVSTTSSRMPMDIVCVLDNSGSMEGSKIESLRVAMKFVRSQLNDGDRLAVVSFNSRAEVVHGLLRMQSTKRVQSDVLCEEIRAGGGTSIYSGMVQAVDILDARRTTNSLSCILLLTDGQDGENMEEKKALGASMRAKGYTLSIFGFGADHDAHQLQVIANAAEGTFSYVERDDLVTDAFGGAIGGAQGTIATNVQVSLRVPQLSTSSASTLRIITANAGRYPCTLQADGSYTVSYANMFAGEQRDVIVVISVPAVGVAYDIYPILHASAQYTAVEGITCRAVPMLSSLETGTPYGAPAPYASILKGEPNTVVCSVKRCITPSEEINAAVDVQVSRFKAMQAMQSAMTSADEGEFERSNALLAQCISTLKTSPGYALKNAVVSSAVDDLEEAMSNTRSAYMYNSIGGKATMCENLTSHSAQRKAYNKMGKIHNPYQSPSSATMQSSASISK
jgi:Mg-chelatase subunit ChlD